MRKFATFKSRFTRCVQNYKSFYARTSKVSTAYSVGGHNIVLNWIKEITDLLQFFVVSVKFGSDYTSQKVVSVLSFW